MSIHSVLIFSICLISCCLRAEDAILVQKKGSNGLYGYADLKTGKFVIEPKFGIVSRPFSEDLAAVECNGKYGFIDKLGNFVIELQSNWTLPGDFKEGLAHVGSPKGGGYIDKKGKMVITPQFSVCCDFPEGLAKVLIIVGEEGKYGYIDKKGKIVIPPTFDAAWDFKNGKASVIIDDKQASINKDGNYIEEPRFPPKAEYTYVMSLKFHLGKGPPYKPYYTFRIRHKGINQEFNTVEDMKEHLKKIPKGSVLEYESDDCISGWEPSLVTSGDEMKRFKEFLSGLGIEMKIIPGG